MKYLLFVFFLFEYILTIEIHSIEFEHNLQLINI